MDVPFLACFLCAADRLRASKVSGPDFVADEVMLITLMGRTLELRLAVAFLQRIWIVHALSAAGTPSQPKA